MDVEMYQVGGEEQAMEVDEDSPVVHPLAMVPYVPLLLEDPVILLTRALARLGIAEHILRESKSNRDRL